MSSNVVDIVNGIGAFFTKAKDWASQAYVNYPQTTCFVAGMVAGQVLRLVF